MFLDPSVTPGSSQDGNIPDDPDNYSTTPSPQDSQFTDEIEENTEGVAADTPLPTPGQGDYNHIMQQQAAIENQSGGHLHTFVAVEPAAVNHHREWQVQLENQQPIVQGPQHTVGHGIPWGHHDPQQYYALQDMRFLTHPAGDGGTAQSNYAYLAQNQGHWTYPPRDDSGVWRECHDVDELRNIPSIFAMYGFLFQI